jgi:hypothetical protein
MEGISLVLSYLLIRPLSIFLDGIFIADLSKPKALNEGNCVIFFW